MKQSVASWWFTAAEIAQLGIPGVPNTARRVHDWATAEAWAQRTARDGTPLARRRTARGGGTEYHASLLPLDAQARLAAQHERTIEPIAANDDTSATANRWAWYEEQSASTKAKAAFRSAILAEIDTLTATGSRKTAAIETVAARHSVSPRAVAGWFAAVVGIAPADRLPFLAPTYKGGGKEIEIDAEAWRILKTDYLRPEKPAFAACYTFLGMWRNLSDQFGKFQGMIADAGFFDAVRRKLQAVLEWVDRLAKNGKLKEWAEAISGRMTEMTNKAYEFVTKVKWDNVAKGIGAIVSGLINVVDWIGRASDAYGRWEIKAARTRELGSYDKVWNRMFGGTYERHQQRERIRDLNRAMGLPENKGLEGEPDDKPRILPQTKGWIGNQQRSLQQYLDRRAPGAAGPAPTGKISLHVSTDRGVTVQPRQMETRGLQVELNTGRMMVSRVA